MVKKYAGTGEVIKDTANEFCERVICDSGEHFGYYIDATSGIYEPVLTDAAIFHYGKKGIHAVPARPRS